MKFAPVRHALPLCSLLAAVTCADHEETAIVIEVTSALPPGAIERVEFVITDTSPGGTAREASALISQRPFPLSVALVQRGGAHGPFDVRIHGLRDNQRVATARPADPMTSGPIAFTSGKIVRRPYVFSGAPEAGMTPTDGDAPRSDAGGPPPDGGAPPIDARAPLIDAGGTPADAGIVGAPDARSDDAPAAETAAPDSPVPVRDAPTPTPDLGRDAAPAAPDLRPPADVCGSGCACMQSCTGSACLCASGCRCSLSCAPGSDCDGECRGDGTSCTVTARAASNATFTCTERATCSIDARGPGTSNVTVGCGSNSSCEIDCTGDVSNCFVNCDGGATCLLRCRSGGNCSFKTCAGGSKSCGGNLNVCNRDCP